MSANIPARGVHLTRGRKIFFSFIAAVLTAGVALLSVCFADRMRYESDAAPPDTPGIYQKIPNGPLPYEHKPGWSGFIAGEYVTINSLGFRGGEVTSGKPLLAVIGDSIVFGQGLQEQATIPACLERRLRQPLDATVLNAGVRGYSAFQYPALAGKALALRPRLAVLVITVVNDPEKEQWKPSSPRLLEMDKSRWMRLPLVRVFTAPMYANEVKKAWVEHVRELYDPRGPYWLPFLDNLRQVRDLCASAGVPLLVVVFPMPGDPGLFAREEGQLEQALNEAGFEWLSVRAALDSLPLRDQVVSRDDFHPGPAAADAAAKMIAERAAKMLR